MPRQLKNLPPTNHLGLSNHRYALLEVTELLEQLIEHQKSLSRELNACKEQMVELSLNKIQSSQKDFLTIEDVKEMYDLSTRMQQDERSAEKIGYIKKNDGTKILYSVEHIREYFKDHYTEFTAKKK